MVRLRSRQALQFIPSSRLLCVAVSVCSSSYNCNRATKGNFVALYMLPLTIELSTFVDGMQFILAG